MSSQNKNGSLLLLKIEGLTNLKIDNEKILYLVLEMDSAKNLINSESLSRPVYFKDFTDRHLFSCTEKDSIQLMTLFKEDTFKHDNTLGVKNFETIENNSNSMNYLMQLDIKSSLYSQKIKISYTLLNCNYCIGTIAKYDSDFMGYKGQIVLVVDKLSIDNKYRIPNENLFSVIKHIDFNNFLFQ